MRHYCIYIYIITILLFFFQPSTDGLLLRGCYTTVTLAVYGNPTIITQESPPKAKNNAPWPPPEKVNAQDRIRDWLEDTKVMNIVIILFGILRYFYVSLLTIDEIV